MPANRPSVALQIWQTYTKTVSFVAGRASTRRDGAVNVQKMHTRPAEGAMHPFGKIDSCRGLQVFPLRL